MVDENLELLNKFYGAMEQGGQHLSTKKGSKSLIIPFLSSRDATKIRELINFSVINSRHLENAENINLNELTKNNYVKKIDLNQYVITPKGILYIENKKGTLLSSIEEYASQNFNSLFEKEDAPFDDREKIVIMAMMASRTFNENYAVDLSTQSARGVWLELLSTAGQKLEDMGLIKSKTSDLLKEKPSGSEPRVVYEFRHLNKLPQKIPGIYICTRSKKYYLNMPTEHNEIRDVLVTLFKKILSNAILRQDQIVNLKEFFTTETEVTRNILFGNKNNPYADSEYDEDIKSSIMRAIVE